MKDKQTQMAIAHIPTLRRYGSELTTLVDEVLDRRVPYDPDDTLAVMLLGFLSRQQEHIRSVHALVDAGCGRDATMIVRAMTEGLAQLLWAYNRSPEGPKLWLDYGHIEDWRQFNDNEKIGIPIDSQQRSDNAAAVAALEQTYYSPKTLKRLDEGKSIPGDPYRRQWNNVDTASIFAAVKGQRLYEDIYRNASDRIHWSPRSIFLALETEESGARIYMADDPRMAATALAASFHSLFQTMEAIDIYFELGHAERLAKIRNEYAKNLSEALE